MQIKVKRINSIEPTNYAGEALRLDIDECSAEDVFMELWELNGDDFIIDILLKEGFSLIRQRD